MAQNRSFMIRLPPELHDYVKMLAVRYHTSLSNVIEKALKDYQKKIEKKLQSKVI